MRLADLSIPELLALANVLLKIAEDLRKADRRSARETLDEVKYILRIVTEKTEQRQLSHAAAWLN
jgi:hypothetical protein